MVIESLIAAALLAAAPGAASFAFERGAACLSGRLAQPDLADPYLAYVYPEESLSTTEGSAGLTYRRVDAAILLALLGREGGLPEPLRAAAHDARGRLAQVTAGWKRAGLADPAAGAARGIALDTFCIVGWLLNDREMAGIAAAGLKGDHWLPEGLYEGEERFRKTADECWCLRLLAYSMPETPLPGAVTGRIAATLADNAARAPAARGTFYEALHLGMALERSPASWSPMAAGAARALVAWAAAHAADATGSDSLPEWINLASAVWLDRIAGPAPREEAVRRLLEAQDGDGCWRLPGASPRDYGSSFVTLRALLGLAPQAVRPAQ